MPPGSAMFCSLLPGPGTAAGRRAPNGDTQDGSPAKVWAVQFRAGLGQSFPWFHGFIISVVSAVSVVYFQENLSAHTAPELLWSTASWTPYISRAYFSSKGTMPLNILCILYHILAAVK